MSVVDLYHHRATIYRISRVLTNGEYVTSSDVYATNVPLRIEERRGEMRVGSQTGNVLEFDAVAYSPPHATAPRPSRNEDVADEIVQTSPATNARYRVLHVMDPSGYQHHRAIYLKALP